MIARIAVAAVLVGAAGASIAVAQEAAAGAAARPLSIEAVDGPLTAELLLDPARPEIGAPIHLRLSARVDTPGAVVEWPNVAELIDAAFGELVVEVETLRPTPDGRAIEGVFRLFDEGEHALPAFSVRVLRVDDAGNPEPLATAVIDGAVVRIDVDLPSDAEPAAALEPLELIVPPPPVPWMWVGVAAAAVALLLSCLVTYLRRPKPLPPPVPQIPPHERALEALEQLASRNLPARGEIEPYFVALSEILRRYLEERFALRAPEQTTEEFLAAVSNTEEGRRAIEAAHRDLLRDFLTRADLVKFAREVPGADACAAAGSGAERFVRDTVPNEVGPAAGEAT